MDSKIIQKRIDDLSAAMIAKGMREPHAQVDIRANEQPQIYLRWKRGFGRDSYGRAEQYKFFVGDISTVFDDASAFVADQPDAEQAKLHDFMAALGSVIDIGRENGIDADFLNPLVASMKKLSENAITDRRAA